MNSIVNKYYEEDPANLALAMLADFELYIYVMFRFINEADFVFKPFHNVVIKKLQDIAFGTNKKRNLCLNIPVGAGKSLIAEYFISWCFAREINNTFIYVSHSDRLINKLSQETKEICQHPTWIKLFGHILKTDQKSKANWNFDKAINRSGLTAGTMGGSITGLDAGNPNIKGFSGALIIDDPVDSVKIRYPLTRQEVINFYSDKLETRRRTAKTPTILIMQRLHKGDLAGYLKEIDSENWDFVEVKALDNNISFWEERYPVKELDFIKRTNPYKFSCQYQQEPITEGGQVIQSKWFQYYQNKSDYKYSNIFITGDTAQKVKEHNDWSVFCCWGVTTENKLFLLDMVRGKWEAPELETNALFFWRRWQRGINDCGCRAFYIEDKASGTGLIQSLKAKHFIPIQGVQRHIDKLTRVEDGLSYIAAGQVFLEVSPEYSYNPTIISECESFARDMSHAHDDFVDNLMDSIKIGISKTKVSIFDVM